MTKKKNEDEKMHQNQIDDSNLLEDIEVDFDAEYEDGGPNLLTNEQYDIPINADAFVNTEGGDVIKREDMTPFEIIKSIAKQNNVKIRDPDDSCKHCYGRGYEGIELKTNMPIPCRCLYRGRTDKEKDTENLYDSGKLNRRLSRTMKRRMAQQFKSEFRRQQREIQRRNKQGLSEPNPEKKEISVQQINKILKEYIVKKSFKKTAKSLDVTLTAVKNAVRNNQEKLEKLQTKELATNGNK